MRMLLAAAALAAPWLSGPARGAEPPSAGTYAILGFLAPSDPPVAELVSEFRQALARQGGIGAVLSEADTKASLGLPTSRAAAAIQRVGDAEGDYQRRLLDSAQAKSEAGLRELADRLFDRLALFGAGASFGIEYAPLRAVAIGLEMPLLYLLNAPQIETSSGSVRVSRFILFVGPSASLRL